MLQSSCAAEETPPSAAEVHLVAVDDAVQYADADHALCKPKKAPVSGAATRSNRSAAYAAESTASSARVHEA
jgi:hypothetical protein